MAQPTNTQGKFVDKSSNPQIQDKQAAIADMTDSASGTPATEVQFTFGAASSDVASLNAKLIEILDVLRYHGLIAGGTQVSAGIAKVIDTGNVPMLGDRQTAITALTDNTGGFISDDVDWDPGLGFKDDMASMVRDINAVLDALRWHGLITGTPQTTEAAARFVDKSNSPQIGVQQAAIADLTDNTGGTISDTIAFFNAGYKDDFASVGAKLNTIIDTLELHGLIADN